MRSRIRDILELYDRRQPFVVCTVVDAHGSVPGKIGATMIVTASGHLRGTVGGAGLEENVRDLALHALRSGAKGRVHRFDLANWKPGGLDSVCGGTVDVSIMVHRPLPHILILGGGHCGLALAELAATMDWDVTVVDPREEFATKQRFPYAVATHAQEPSEWIEGHPLEEFSHAYVLGHSHDVDTAALAALLPRFTGHVGLIGSLAKRQSIVDRLRTQGIADQALTRVQCPVGVDVGAETPAEIAVAIAAEIISTLKRLETPREAHA